VDFLDASSIHDNTARGFQQGKEQKQEQKQEPEQENLLSLAPL